MKKILLAMVLSACAATIPATDQVRIHAAHDLKCDENQVQTTQVDARTVRVSACGHDTTYIEQCETEGTTRCTWVARAGGAPAGGTTVSP